MTPQSEESKKRMEELGKNWRYPNSKRCWVEAYQAGMQDPEANSERIKQLEGLLGECEKYIHRIKDHSVSKGYLNVVGLSRQMIYLIDEYKELKAAKEGGK